MADGIAKIFLGYVLAVVFATLQFGILISFAVNRISDISHIISGVPFMAAGIALFAAPVVLPTTAILMLLRRKRYLEYAACGYLCPLLLISLFAGFNPLLALPWLVSSDGLPFSVIGAFSAYPMWAICTDRWPIFDNQKDENAGHPLV